MLITGLQLEIAGVFGVHGLEDVKRFLSSDEAYVVVRVGDVEHLRMPVIKFASVASGEWFDLGPAGLPLDKTRFDVPAWARLHCRLAQKR